MAATFGSPMGSGLDMMRNARTRGGFNPPANSSGFARTPLPARYPNSAHNFLPRSPLPVTTTPFSPPTTPTPTDREFKRLPSTRLGEREFNYSRAMSNPDIIASPLASQFVQRLHNMDPARAALALRFVQRQANYTPPPPLTPQQRREQRAERYRALARTRLENSRTRRANSTTTPATSTNQSGLI